MTPLKDRIEDIRACFPALSRRVGDAQAVFCDGPAGTQVPHSVIDAVCNYYRASNANHGGHFVTSRETDEILAQAHAAGADFLGASDPECVSFGPNMTTITMALARAIAQTWRAGDEVIVTRLDHDANVAPWILAARDKGVTVHHVPFHTADCTLDLEYLRSKLSPRTRLVAVGCASNVTGTMNPVRQITSWAHDVGALVFLDAVHMAPHSLIDVEDFGCDFLACSVYKFFGPHIGMLWGRRELLEEIQPYKLRPASDDLPDRWMTGTQNHEGLAGTVAAVDYLAGLTAEKQERRESLKTVFRQIEEYERTLTLRLLDGLQELPYLVHGITDPSRIQERSPTVSITHSQIRSGEICQRLADAGIFTWQGNHYAIGVTESLGIEPDGTARIGFVHYNTEQEVDRVLSELKQIASRH